MPANELKGDRSVVDDTRQSEACQERCPVVHDCGIESRLHRLQDGGAVGFTPGQRFPPTRRMRRIEFD